MMYISSALSNFTHIQMMPFRKSLSALRTLKWCGAKKSRKIWALGPLAAASTATGISTKHKKEQQAIIDGAFAK